MARRLLLVTALAVTTPAVRDYLEPALRLLLAVLAPAFSAAVLEARSCSSRSGRSGEATAGRRGVAGTDEAAGRPAGTELRPKTWTR